MTINVDAEREAVARLLYRFTCEAEPGWAAEGPWEDAYWDELLVDSEREEYRGKAMLLMDAMVEMLTVAWQRLDESDDRLREIHALCDAAESRHAGQVRVMDLRRVLGGAT